MKTIRNELEALLDKARLARADARAKMTNHPDDYTAATLKWQALNEVVGDLERTLMHFQRPATAGSLVGI